LSAIDPLGLRTVSLGINGNLALGIGGGGGLDFNFGYSEQDGYSFSITGTAQGGAIAGAGGIIGGRVPYTNADNVNQLNGTSYQAGRAGLGPVAVEGIMGMGMGAKLRESGGYFEINRKNIAVIRYFF